MLLPHKDSIWKDPFINHVMKEKLTFWQCYFQFHACARFGEKFITNFWWGDWSSADAINLSLLFAWEPHKNQWITQTQLSIVHAIKWLFRCRTSQNIEIWFVFFFFSKNSEKWMKSMIIKYDFFFIDEIAPVMVINHHIFMILPWIFVRFRVTHKSFILLCFQRFVVIRLFLVWKFFVITIT